MHFAGQDSRTKQTHRQSDKPEMRQKGQKVTIPSASIWYKVLDLTVGIHKDSILLQHSKSKTSHKGHFIYPKKVTDLVHHEIVLSIQQGRSVLLHEWDKGQIKAFYSFSDKSDNHGRTCTVRRNSKTLRSAIIQKLNADMTYLHKFSTR